jgi:hypothetical protein
MTDSDNSPGRIDLRALAPDAVEEERLVGAVMGRIAGRPQLPPERPDAVLEIVAGILPSRWLAAAAAAIILLSAAIVSLRRNPPPSPEAVIAAWADRQHVPTNGELLHAFLGYTP